MLEKVIGAANLVMMDGDALLRAQLVDQLLHRAGRHHFVRRPLNDDAARRAGGEEREVIHVRRRRDRNEAADFRPAHQQLHADPRAEGKARDPGRLCFGMEALHPVERGRRVGQFANAVVERALAAADAAEVEAQRGEAPLHERLVERLGDAVVHRAAALRMGVQDHRDRRAWARRRAKAAFEAAFGSGENDVGHGTCYRSGPPIPHRDPGSWG